MNTLKQFDAFAKPLEEVQIKTVWGGIGKKMVFSEDIIIFNMILQLYSSVSIYHIIVMLYLHISTICNIIVLIINSYNFVIFNDWVMVELKYFYILYMYVFKVSLYLFGFYIFVNSYKIFTEFLLRIK